MSTQLEQSLDHRADRTAEKVGEANQLFATRSKRNLVLCLFLGLLVICTYSPVGQNAFINFDDRQYIIQNPHVRSGLTWETVKWAFTAFNAGNWHPLTWLSHAFDFQMFGLNAAGHHFISVFFHASNAALLFLLFETLTGLEWRSLLLAALFAVHPLNVESVVWAAERKNVLSMFFFLLALLAYCWYVRRRSLGRYAAVTGLFALALMSKPQVITFPFVLLLLDYWPPQAAKMSTPGRVEAPDRLAQQSFSSRVTEKIPWFVLSAFSAVITMQAQRAGNAVRSTVEYSLGSRLETAITSYVWYLRDVFFPIHLAPIYPHPPNLIPTWEVLLAFLVLVGITTAAVFRRKRQPYLLFGWLWFLGTLVPMIGLVQVGEQARADRYMYIPVIGILVVAVWSAAELLERYRLPMAWRVAMSAIVVALLCAATYQQIGRWKNSETLWTYTLSVTKNNFMAEDNLAQELATQGRTQEALVHFHRILRLHNWPASDLIAFGMYEQRNGYAEDAIQQYQSALRVAADAKTQAIAFGNIGSAYLDLKNANAAGENFASALQLDPQNAQALLGSGIVAQKKGNPEFAAQQYTKAVSIQPSDLGYQLLGSALEQSGKSADAERAYKEAEVLSQNYEDTRKLAQHLLAQ